MQAKKTNSYKFSDSSKMFLWAVLAPQILGVVLVMIIGVVINMFGLDYQQVLDSFVVNLSILFLAQIAFLIAFFLYNKLKGINWQQATKIKVKINLKQTGVLILIAITSLCFLAPLIGLIDYLVSLTGFSAASDLPVDLTKASGFIAGFFALAVLPSIAEELIFRGVIYNGLLRFGYKKAIIISALLFALMHMSIQQTFYQIIIGAMLAYSLYITGSLLAPIVMHFANNFIIILLITFDIGNGVDVEEAASFASFYDYLRVAIFTAIGIFIIWQLFKILKRQTNKVPETKTPITETQAMLEDASQSQLLLPENLEIITEQKEQILAKTQKVIDKGSYKLIGVAVIISILLWLFDFFSKIG
jgi:uncharacterized protein